MEILGRTSLGRFLIVVSEEELKIIDKKLELSEQQPKSLADTEIYKILKKEKLPGIPWMFWLYHLIEKGCLDGSIVQLKTAIEADEPYLHAHRLSKKAITKIYDILNDHT